MTDDPALMTQAERDRYARDIAERIDKAVELLVKIALPPGAQYVLVIGFKDQVGMMTSNVEDLGVVLQFLSTAQGRIKQ